MLSHEKQPTPRKFSPSNLGSVTEEPPAESAITSKPSAGPAASGGTRAISGSSHIWDVKGSVEGDNTKPKQASMRSNSSVEMLVSAGSNLPNLKAHSMSAVGHLAAVTLSSPTEEKRETEHCDPDKVGHDAGGTAEKGQRALEADDPAQMDDASDSALGGTGNEGEGRLTIWDAMKENTEAVSSHAGVHTNRSRRTFFTDAASRFHCSASTLIEADRWSDHLGSFTSDESPTNTSCLGFGNDSPTSGSSMSYEVVQGDVFEVKIVEGSAVAGKDDHGGPWGVSPSNRDSVQAGGDRVPEGDDNVLGDAVATDRQDSSEPPGSTANARSKARDDRPAAVVAGGPTPVSDAQQILEARVAAHEAFMTAQLEIMRKEMEQKFESFRAAAEQRTDEETKTSLRATASPDEQGNTSAKAEERESSVQCTSTSQNKRSTGAVFPQHGNVDGLSRDGRLQSAIPQEAESLGAIAASSNTGDSSKSSDTPDGQGSLWSIFTEGGGEIDVQRVDRPDERRVQDENTEEKDSDYGWVRRVYEVQVRILR